MFGLAGLVFGFLAMRMRLSRGVGILIANCAGILLGVLSNVLLLV